MDSWLCVVHNHESMMQFLRGKKKAVSKYKTSKNRLVPETFCFLFLSRKLHRIPQCAWARKLLTVKVVQILIRLKIKSSFSRRGRKYVDTLPPFFLMQNISLPCNCSNPMHLWYICKKVQIGMTECVWALTVLVSDVSVWSWLSRSRTHIYIYIYSNFDSCQARVTSNKVRGRSLPMSVSSHITSFPPFICIQFISTVKLVSNAAFFFFFWQEAENGHATETPLHHQSRRIPASPVLILV